MNLASELCKVTFSKFSVKSFLAKPLSDHLSDLTAHSQHPHSAKVFPDVQKEPPVLQVVPVASGPVTGHH